MSDRRQVINENRSKLFGGDGRVVAFICECADPSCQRSVMLTASQAAAVRESNGWIVAEGHEPIDDVDDLRTGGTVIAFPTDDR